MKFRMSPIAAAVLAVYALPGNAQETTPPAQVPSSENATQLPTVKVQDEAVNDYKPEKAASPKYTEPLRDTPQTITIIPRQVIEDQNLLSLRDVLSTVPGITFGAGEGGGGYGDSITIRGFTGSNDISIDGVRDSAQYTRSDMFNLEQLEVVNGASSVYSGAGAVGGTINLVSKTAQQERFARISGGIGTDSYGRFTADVNQPLSDGVAARVNLMVHQNDAPGRDYESFDRWGIAPTIALGLGTPTRLKLSYFHQHDENIPQYGVPFYNGRGLPGVDTSNYYGYHNVDTQEIDADYFTAIVEHDFSDKISVRNLSRYGRTTQFTIANPPQGTYCLPENVTPTGGVCQSGTGASAIIVEPGFYLPTGPRGTTRDTENDILTNQTDITWNFSTGPVAHTLVTGFAFTHENYDLVSGNSQRNPDGSVAYPSPPGYPQMDIYNPDSTYAGPINFIPSATTDGSLDNQALYAFDTLKFGEQWQFTTGLRYERNEGDSVGTSIATPADGGAVTTNPRAENNDDLLSYRAALLFKPMPNGSVYVSYGNSETPSKASVNGSCTLTSTTGTANCTVDPEEARSYEIGTKWDVLGGNLALTAAIFRNDRTNYRVNDPVSPENPSGEQALDGQSRVDGLELGASGKLSQKWSAFANYTYLKSEVLQGASDAVDEGTDYSKGDDLVNVPEHSFNLWTTYELPYGLQVGYGVHYEGEVYLTQHNANNIPGSDGEVPLVKTESYFVHRASVSYQATPKLDLQLNINNLTDEEYYSRMRNNGWATPGDARAFILTANYDF